MSFIAILCLHPTAEAFNEIKCYIVENCGTSIWTYSANPSSGNEIKINPSAVPTEKGLGIETLFYRDTPDFAIVRGFGRVGAAISPSNNEDTFFGPPSFETPQDFFTRKLNGDKYLNKKITLASAMALKEKNGSGFFDRYSLKLGFMGKYNELTKSIKGGGGLSGVLGPFTAGFSFYEDETQLINGLDGISAQTIIKYQVLSYNLGVYLGSLILDYSNLRIQPPYEANVNLFTASLMFKKLILTASKRIEDSTRPYYNFDTKKLESRQVKEEHFAGLQYSISNPILLGVFYNYYQLRELSAAVTVFF